MLDISQLKYLLRDLHLMPGSRMGLILISLSTRCSKRHHSELIERLFRPVLHTVRIDRPDSVCTINVILGERQETVPAALVS